MSYALLTATADSTFAMHRLVQDVARGAAGPVACAESIARAVALVARVLPDRPWEHEQWPLCARLLEHALSATRHADKHGAARELTATVLAGLGLVPASRAGSVRHVAASCFEHALGIEEAVHGPSFPRSRSR